MKKIRLILYLQILLITPSCSVLTKSQVDAVGRLAVAADTVVASPARLFGSLSEVRMGRGLFYAASISTPSLSATELNEVAKAYSSDISISEKISTYTSILGSYIRSLKSLSSPIRYKQAGVELRGIGRNIDSLLLKYNTLENEDIPIGFAKISGKYAAYLTETYLKYKQAYLLKGYVSECDTLVALCVDEIVSLMRKKDVEELILHEEISLKSDYENYLSRLSLGSFPPDFHAAKEYVSLYKTLSDAKNFRQKCITALLSFKRAHHSLVSKLKEKAEIEYFYEEYLEITDLLTQSPKGGS